MSIKIIADMREARSNIANLMRKTPDVEVVVEELSCGDYLLREDFPVERKAATDFILSIQDRRLFEQIAKMKGEYGRATFIVEGDLQATRSQMQPDAIRGALSYLVAIEGATIMPSSGPADSAGLMATMARHLQQGLGYEVSLRGAKPKDLRTQAQFIVEGFPGVGPGTARALLTHFGSIAALFAADIAALRQVPGIGPKSAQQIRAVIEARYAAA